MEKFANDAGFLLVALEPLEPPSIYATRLVAARKDTAQQWCHVFVVMPVVVSAVAF